MNKYEPILWTFLFASIIYTIAFSIESAAFHLIPSEYLTLPAMLAIVAVVEETPKYFFIRNFRFQWGFATIMFLALLETISYSLIFQRVYGNGLEVLFHR